MSDLGPGAEIAQSSSLFYCPFDEPTNAIDNLADIPGACPQPLEKIAPPSETTSKRGDQYQPCQGNVIRLGLCKIRSFK